MKLPIEWLEYLTQNENGIFEVSDNVPSKIKEEMIEFNDLYKKNNVQKTSLINI